MLRKIILLSTGFEIGISFLGMLIFLLHVSHTDRIILVFITVIFILVVASGKSLYRREELFKITVKEISLIYKNPFKYILGFYIYKVFLFNGYKGYILSRFSLSLNVRYLVVINLGNGLLLEWRQNNV